MGTWVIFYCEHSESQLSIRVIFSLRSILTLLFYGVCLWKGILILGALVEAWFLTCLAFAQSEVHP